MGERKIGLLLVNLGTPQSPDAKAVFRYLNEFLTDGRVIDMPWLQRQCLVRGFIVPSRYRQSAELYRRLWTQEGSPLLVHGLAVKERLQGALGEDFKVALAMRYQHPSIAEGLQELKQARVREIIVFPLFPQYASATTGSVHQKVMDCLKNWQVIPKLTFVNSYCDHPAFIHAICESAKSHALESYDHILFSFHGLPESQIRKGDCARACLAERCCERLHGDNVFCYKAQCYATARALVAKLGLTPDQYTICFQSRLGKAPWIQPYTSDTLHQCAAKGYRRLLVFCPSFVCDCLETTCEVLDEYAQEFKRLGGETLDLVQGLNSLPAWIEALQVLVLEQTHASPRASSQPTLAHAC